MTSPEEFLFGAGQSAKFENPGDRISGIVLTDPVMRPQLDYNTKQPKFWPSGEPMEQLVIRLLTQQRNDADDDGVRVTYIDSQSKREALRDAVRDAGGKKILVGGFIDQIYTGDGPKTGGGNPPKLYAFQYQQPTQQTLAAVEAYRAGPTQPPAQQGYNVATQNTVTGQPYTQTAPPQWGQPPAQTWGPPPQPAQGFPQAAPISPYAQQVPPQPPQPAQQIQAPQGQGNYVSAAQQGIPVPPPQQPQQAAQPAWNAEIIAALKNAGHDPKTIYPDYDGRYDQ